MAHTTYTTQDEMTWLDGLGSHMERVYLSGNMRDRRVFLLKAYLRVSESPGRHWGLVSKDAALAHARQLLEDEGKEAR